MHNLRKFFGGAAWICWLVLLPGRLVAAPELELTNAVVVFPSNLTGAARKTVTMLVEEVEKRTRVRWPELSTWPAKADSAVAVIAVGPKSQLDAFGGPYARDLQDSQTAPAEGYRLCVRRNSNQSVVLVIGNDARGVLFGVGRLLRELHMRPGSITLTQEADIATAPTYSLRGHQLGYRPKCNSYDAWDLPVWEQYFRDLAAFGCNSVELIPPRSDDDSESPHSVRPPMEMLRGMSPLAADYGLALWVWSPSSD